MKRIFLLLAFAGTFAAANAQTKYGVKGGLNVANVGGADVENNNSKLGFHVGGFANFGVADKITIQPELLYSLQGAKFDGLGYDVKHSYSYLNIPVMFRYEVLDGLNIQAGPQLGFLLSAKEKIGGNKESIQDEMKTFELGLGMGASFQFPSSPFGVDARYNFGLSKLDEDGRVKSHNRVLQVGVFYVLGQK